MPTQLDETRRKGRRSVRRIACISSVMFSPQTRDGADAGITGTSDRLRRAVTGGGTCGDVSERPKPSGASERQCLGRGTGRVGERTTSGSLEATSSTILATWPGYRAANSRVIIPP
jgi:hypothetical protein